jgi:hypothetical protein
LARPPRTVRQLIHRFRQGQRVGVLGPAYARCGWHRSWRDPKVSQRALDLRPACALGSRPDLRPVAGALAEATPAPYTHPNGPTYRPVTLRDPGLFSATPFGVSPLHGTIRHDD